MDYANILEGVKDPKNTELRSGYSIARLIREVDMVESRIGSISDGTSTGPRYLITTGMQVDSMGTPTHILGDCRISLEVSQKLRSIRGKSAASLLKQYIDDSKSPDGAQLMEKLRNIESNKLLLTPIKPKMSCEVMVEEEVLDERLDSLPDSERTIKKRSRIKTSTIEIVKWFTDTKTGQLRCCILTEVLDGTSGKRAKIDIEEYGSKLFLTDIERSIKVGANTEHKLIRMTRYGYIKPIKILNNLGNGLIIDNSFVYSLSSYDTDGNELTPIAYWNNADELVGDETFNKIQKTMLYKAIKKNMVYVAQHRRYIAPSGTADYNVVTI